MDCARGHLRGVFEMALGIVLWAAIEIRVAAVAAVVAILVAILVTALGVVLGKKFVPEMSGQIIYCLLLVIYITGNLHLRKHYRL